MYCYTYKASKTTTGVLDKTEKHENPDRLASRGTIYSECAHSREWYGHLLVEKDCDNNMPRGEDCVASQKMIVMKFYLYSKNKRKSKSQPTSHSALNQGFMAGHVKLISNSGRNYIQYSECAHKERDMVTC